MGASIMREWEGSGNEELFIWKTEVWTQGFWTGELKDLISSGWGWGGVGD